MVRVHRGGILILLMQSYPEPNEVRRAEYEDALARNQGDGLFRKVIGVDVEGTRLTFRDAFFIADAVAKDDEIAIVANADVSFDASILRSLHMGERDLWAISRWDAIPKDGIPQIPTHGLDLSCAGDGRPATYYMKVNPHKSQDVWAYRAPLRTSGPCDLKISMGLLGCDNRIAHELHVGGYHLQNPWRRVFVRHHHASEIRNHSKEDRVPGPYRDVRDE